MVEAVMTFALLSSLFEFVLISKLKPRTRLRVLGSRTWTVVLHTVCIVGNLVVHYGTLTGSMTAVVAGLSSFAVMPLAKLVYGHVTNNQYHAGLRRYTLEQLA